MAELAAVVVTASYGGYDQLQPQVAQDVEVEWVCFTDDPNLVAPAPWRVEYRIGAYEHPCMAAKVHKLVPTVDTPNVIWIDANMQVTSRTFVREALYARHDGIAVFRHPRRDCIYTEAEASVGAEAQGGKYAGLPIMEQVAHYRDEGYPEHAGLYACGVVAWEFANPVARRLGRAWMAECARWTFQDQLSLPVVARQLKVKPGVFPLDQIQRSRPRWLENRWLRIFPHLR